MVLLESRSAWHMAVDKWLRASDMTHTLDKTPTSAIPTHWREEFMVCDYPVHPPPGVVIVYLIQPTSEETVWYVGVTDNFTHRLSQHNAGRCTTTFAYHKWRLRAYVHGFPFQPSTHSSILCIHSKIPCQPTFKYFL